MLLQLLITIVQYPIIINCYINSGAYCSLKSKDWGSKFTGIAELKPDSISATLVRL